MYVIQGKLARPHAGRLRRRLLLALATCCFGALAGPGVSANAQVPSVDLVCLASAQFNFSPPLNFNTTSASLVAVLTNCVSPNGSQPQLSSAQVTSTAIASGCSPLPLTIGGVLTVTWNDGTTSTWTYSVGTDPTNPGGLGLNALTTAGTLVGDSVVAAPVIISQNGLCLFGGVRSLSVNMAAVAWTH